MKVKYKRTANTNCMAVLCGMPTTVFGSKRSAIYATV